MSKKFNSCQSYSQKELVSFYNVSRKVFVKWLIPFHNDIGDRVGNYYTSKQVQIIVDKIGPPPTND